MGKSLYRKILFIIVLLCLFILTIIAVKIEAFNIIIELLKLEVVCLIFDIFQVTYVSNILCSIIAVVIIYIAQVKYSKMMLKKDFRCNEIIECLYRNIPKAIELAKGVPEITKWDGVEDYNEKLKRDAVLYYDFYKNNRGIIDIVSYALYYHNNDILIESVQSCFLINLNFRLLNIMNNIKNRLPNLRNNYPTIQILYEEYTQTENVDELIKLGNMLHSYFTDLHFMALYWLKLLEYLEYDYTYIEFFIQLYNENYNIEEDIKLSRKEQDMRFRNIHKKAKKAVRKYKFKNFWNK